MMGIEQNQALKTIGQPRFKEHSVTVEIPLSVVVDLNCGDWARDEATARVVLAEHVYDWIMAATNKGDRLHEMARVVNLDRLKILDGPTDEDGELAAKMQSEKAGLKIVAKPLVMRKRYEYGCDWGRERYVLAKLGTKELQLTQGHTTWSGVGSTSYCAQRVIVMDYGPNSRRDTSDEVLEGRWSKAAWEKALPKLQKHFHPKAAVDLVRLLSKKHTLEIEEV